MGKEAPLFSIGEKVIAKDGTIFVISEISGTRGRYSYSGRSKKSKVTFPEGSLQLYKPQAESVKISVLYAYENLRTGEVKKYTRQKNENQHSKRAPQFDEKWIAE